jgi:serine/threonine protein phosphatase PrpC
MHEALLEPRIEHSDDSAEMKCAAVAGGSCVLYTSRCPGKATPNEDSAIIIPRGERAAVLAVADGVGGMRGGELASRIVLQALRDSVGECGDGEGSLRTAILNGIDAANRAVLALGIGAASTLVVVELEGQSIRPYHIGDSMILNVGQRGKIKLQTISHSPVGFAIESGLLDPAAAMLHSQRHVVSNVIGSPDMRIEIGSAVEMDQRDTLILASDGLSDNLHVKEIIEYVRKGALDEGVNAMTVESRRRMISQRPGRPSKPDDMTVIVYRPVKPAKAKLSRGKSKRAAGAA